MSTAATSETELRPAGPPAGGLKSTESLNELRLFFLDLLRRQCELVGGLGGVVYLVGTGTRGAGVFVRSPVEEEMSDQRAAEINQLFSPDLVRRLEGLGERAASGDPESGLSETITLARPGGIYEPGATHVLLATPIEAAGRVEGALILAAPIKGTDVESALKLLALGSLRFETYLWQQQAMREAEQRATLRETLEFLDVAQQGPTARSMGELFCHELKRRFGCTRVSIGLISRDRIRLEAVSGSDDLDRKGAAVSLIEACMDEAADQDTEVIFPPPVEAESEPGLRRVTRAHHELSRKFGPATMLSLPLRVEGDLVGVVLLERDADDPFPAAAAPLLRLVAEFIGPALWTRRLADRGILAVARDRMFDFGSAIVGPRHTLAKLISLIVGVLLLASAIVPVPARVTSDASIDAAVSRTIPPPFEGYLDAVSARPGDTVEEGQVLATMDTSDLELELEETNARLNTLQTQRDDAQAEGRAADVRMAAASINETQARIDRLTDSMVRASIRAPIAGRIGRGDLEAFVGARVSPSQPLFEIVTDEIVVVIEVDERNIGRVEPGQRGSFTLRALPDQRVGLEVLRINPMANVVRSSNVYLVEAKLDEPPSELRPGMTGSARLDAGRTTILTLFLSPIIDEVRLRWWW